MPEIIPDNFTLDLEEETISIKVVRNKRARRYTLRLPHSSRTPVLTIPNRGSLEEASGFVGKHRDWLQDKLQRAGHPIPIAPGATIPLRGEPHDLQMSGKIRGSVRVIHGYPRPSLYIPGDKEHFERRAIDWLKKEARRDLMSSCHKHAEALSVEYRAITIRDQRTRWGSCSSNGRLNFSWRLILTTPEVLDYVAAHEVAHLREMNHSARFWSLVEKLCPEMERHRHWLRHNGGQLHRYGCMN